MAVKQEKAADAHHFGRTFGSPPGLPGEGITGIEPLGGFGVGACICGSTPGGGHSTPSDWVSVSPSGLLVSSLGVDGWMLPSAGPLCVGAHFVDGCSGLDGTVGVCGVADAGAACAIRTEGTDVKVKIIVMSEIDIRMTAKWLQRADVPAEISACDTGSARSVPSAASAAARSGRRRHGWPPS